jgi:hypothetical protein
LSFEDICEKIRQVGTSRILPTAILVGSLEGAEVRVLAHLVRCRVSGFMVLLPALEEVFALLEQLVDGDGDSLVVQKEVDVPLEDARGRRFGSGQMVLVDMPAECAAHFVRTPALRGNAAAGLLRMMAQNSIAPLHARSSPSCRTLDQRAGRSGRSFAGVFHCRRAGDARRGSPMSAQKLFSSCRRALPNWRRSKRRPLVA